MSALTFDESAAETVIESFGWELTNTGYICGDDIVPSITGQPVHIDDLAGVVEYEGDPRPLRDDFNELVEYVKHRHGTADPQDTEPAQVGDRDE